MTRLFSVSELNLIEGVGEVEQMNFLQKDTASTVDHRNSDHTQRHSFAAAQFIYNSMYSRDDTTLKIYINFDQHNHRYLNNTGNSCIVSNNPLCTENRIETYRIIIIQLPRNTTRRSLHTNLHRIESSLYSSAVLKCSKYKVILHIYYGVLI
jgi:hypothetical protein